MKNATLKNGLKAALVVGGVCLLIPSVHGQGIGVPTLERQLVPTAQKIERGAQVYAQQCSSCHGDQGRGGAPIGERLGAQGFIGELEHATGVISIRNIVARGLPEAEHPVFPNLFFQDQWAVAHYVHSLVPDPQADPPHVVEEAYNEARFGLCDPNVRESLADVIEPRDEQIEAGRTLYAAQCASCHGDQGRGDGPAGQVLVPPARDFHDAADKWTESPSPLAVFNVLTQGIDGTSMPAFAHLSEEERWALTHFTVSLIPEKNREAVTAPQLEDVCRSLSMPARPPSIDIDNAMRFLIADADERRAVRLAQHGTTYVADDARADRGEQVYNQTCASCHGAQGTGMRQVGPYGSFPPYLYLQVSRLVPASVGGTHEDVAQRSIGGPHATLGAMTAAAQLSVQDWKDLQAYVAGFAGEGNVRPLSQRPAAQPAVITPAEPDGDEIDTEESNEEGEGPAEEAPEEESPEEAPEE